MIFPLNKDNIEPRQQIIAMKPKNISILLIMVVSFTLLASCQVKDMSEWTDEESMVMALEWQEANPIHAKDPTDWTNGAYYTGVSRAHKTTNDQAYINALTDMGERNGWQTWERYFHADDVAISYAYLYLKSLGNADVDLGPTDAFIQDHLYKKHAWKEGNPQKDQRILWWWCDALFMAPPVLTSYANLKNDQKYLHEMDKYYQETYNLLFDKEENLFARDLRYQWKGDSTDIKEENGKKVFWSRGNGWVLGGLALILDAMPKDYVNRSFYESLYLRMAKKIKSIQHEDGLWRTSLLCPESWNHGEVSGSGFYTFALAWGINNGMLDRGTYGPAVRKAWAALRACQQPNGKIGWVQNIGADPQPADKDSWQNYGTGAFLLAGSEILKFDEKEVAVVH